MNRIPVLLLALQLPLSLSAQIPSFPGAEGFGAHATGGRGGDVYYVTNLNSSGAGSLFEGVETAPSSGRTILFKVSGYIPIANYSQTGDKTLRIVQNNIRIDGSTAPGAGIALKDGRILVTGDNTVIRNIRIRHGAAGGAGDCLNVQAQAANTIIDHVSMEFSTDEIFSMYEGSNVDNITMQSSIAALALESHSKGGLWNVERATCVDSLWAHITDRNPKARPAGLLEWVNNVTLNYGVGFQMGSTTTPASYKANVIGNYFVHSRYGDSSLALEQARIDRNGNPNFFLWLDDCLHDSAIENYPGSQSGVLNGTDKGFSIVEGTAWISGQSYSEGQYVYVRETAPHAGSSGNVALTVDDPLTALKKVVSDTGAVRLDAAYLGALRDEVDTVVVDDVINQRRRQINGEYNLPVSNSGFGTLTSAPAPADTDLDGMPDYWETALGHNPTADDHNSVFSSTAGTFFPAGTPTGYTFLEEYLHFKMVPHIATAPNTAATPSSFTTDLRKFTAGFSNAPAFSITALNGGTVQQFAADGTTPSGTGPIVEFTPAQDYTGRAGFLFTVTDADGSQWMRQFAILVADGISDSTDSGRVRINVDFDKGSPYTGSGAALDTGTVWNVIAAPASSPHTQANVLDTTGAPTAQSVTISSSSGGFSSWTQGDLGNPSPSGLMDDYFFGNTYTVTVSNLPEGAYHLYVYAHGDQADQNSTVTLDAANGGAAGVTGDTGGQYRNIFTSGAEGYSYLFFEPTVGAGGTLTFSVHRYLNGFQLISPSTETSKNNYFVDCGDAGSTGNTRTISAMPGWGYSGAAPATGEIWNVFNERDFDNSTPNLSVGQTWTIVDGVTLINADSSAAGAQMSVVYHAATDALTSDRLSTLTGQGTLQPGGVMEKLMRNYWDRGGAGNFQRFTISGLSPDTEHLLYIYSASVGTQAWRAHIDLDQDGSVDMSTTDNGSTDALFADSGGVISLTPQGQVWNRATVTSDSSGNIVFDSRGHLSGFQIMEVEPPEIVTQPVSETANTGGEVTFTVEASASPPPTYQWHKDGSPLAGENAAHLTVSNISLSDLGSYTVVVTNEGGTVTSDPATLGLSDPCANYVAGFGLNPETNGAPAVDHDLDGLVNLMECFLGTDPTARDGLDRLPVGSATTGGPAGIVFEFDRFKGAAGIPYIVEYSFDLTATWFQAENGEEGVTIDVDVPETGDFDHITVTIPADSDLVFARLRLP